MSRLFIVRHGNTFAPDEKSRRIGRASDLPLVASGLAQARQLGAFFAGQNLSFNRVLTGPLRRAHETADLIGSYFDDPTVPEVAGWLDEIDYGPDEGLTEAEVKARIGERGLLAWDQHGIAPPGWRVDREERLRGWREFAAGAPAGDTLLVTSNGAARFALLALLHSKPTGGLRLRTGAYGVLRWNETGWQLETWDEHP